MQNKTILIADDDPNVLASLDFLLTEEGYQLIAAQSPHQALSILEYKSVDLILTDLNFTQDTTSGNEGIELVQQIKQRCSHIPILVMTGWATIKIAVNALKAGAKDFIQKPWHDEQLLAAIDTQLQLAKALKKSSLLSQHNKLLSGLNHPADKSGIVAESQVMKQLIDELEQLAQSEMNILLTGDNGTGKSMLARFVHQASPRQTMDFVAVNMGAIAENLFESEMFGHSKGAFTDAKTDRVGRFEMAEGGTLFLDELANIPLSQQAKLLRVLEERQFERLGSSYSLAADVRVISATNADLPAAIANNEFRQDLYYRLNTVELRVPTLAERQDDIEPLAQLLLQRFSQKYHRPMPKLSTQALYALKRYHWPGNIRELSHVLERAIFLAKNNTIELKQLNIVSTASTINGFDDSNATLEQIEKFVMQSRLKLFAGNVTETAKSLGLSRSGYYRRIQKYELD